MPDRDINRRRAEELLRQAAETQNLAERSRLIGEATMFHMRAVEAEVGKLEGDLHATRTPEED
ncbi:MAG: hypothetical protein ACK4TR_12585 [Phenylobacterium sp.]|uniref:hypothetical protein n=1 Tax=unclassified Phenylobacterium TaxID=2640670 RepID=UPI00086ABC29|nr:MULTISPECIES: hypothetical protein [unclassified Phenylobacterium]MCR5873095.1 hypothetical protein [Phenylobacterium sp. J426]ODT85525.1 MAG: hypothetical protein ABS78_19960 [Phenylobacterium sp. SCN 70-31]